MKSKWTEKEWLEDFNEFVNSEGVPVPQEISEKILNRVHRDLNPSAYLVFIKLLFMQSLVGTLSLGICNQFGINPFNTNFSLSDYFMKFGHSFCMTLCGVIFIGLGLSLGQSILNSDEFRVLKKNSLIQVFFLSLFSLVALAAFGSEVVFGIGILWLLGALVGGMISIQATSIFVRRHTA